MTSPTESGTPNPCTCHPDDNPPTPCPRKYALTDCRIADLERQLAEKQAVLEKYGKHKSYCAVQKRSDGIARDGMSGPDNWTDRPPCTCGLDAALAPPQGEPKI